MMTVSNVRNLIVKVKSEHFPDVKMNISFYICLGILKFIYHMRTNIFLCIALCGITMAASIATQAKSTAAPVQKEELFP